MGFERALCYPGDEQHPVFPGPAAARHRMVMAGKFGSKMRYGLRMSDDEQFQLPLDEAASAYGWPVVLAKL